MDKVMIAGKGEGGIVWRGVGRYVGSKMPLGV